jgi:hypothetical protein
MKTLEELADLTKDAYSVDTYTDSGWKAAMRILQEAGVRSENIVWFMLSKHTRWAGDESPLPRGKYSSNTIQKYLNKNPDVMLMLKTETRRVLDMR